MATSTRNRAYESPLRLEQSERTRQKLIQAGVDVVVDEGGEELTVRRVAAVAGVSVPTAYRHFPDRDALLEGMAAWMVSRIAGAANPTSAEEVSGWVRNIFNLFEENDRLVRAQLITPAGRALREKHRQKRNTQILEMMKRSFPTATEATQRRLTALIRLLGTVAAWVPLVDDWGMSGAEAGNTVAWAIETLFAEVRRNPTTLDFERHALPTAAPTPSAPPSATPRNRRARRSDR